jgi:hypothetical protein
MDKKNRKRPNQLQGRWPKGKVFSARIMLPLAAEMLSAIDHARDQDANETRLDVIRGAIDRELERRERKR